MSFTRDQRRKILLEHRYVYTAGELCARWRVSRYELRKWKREFDYPNFTGDFRDWVIAAIHRGIDTLPGIIDYLDFLNHCRYSPEEVLEALRELESEGIAEQRGERWIYGRTPRAGSPSYIF